MARHTLIVLSNPISAAQEDEYNEWYDRQHIPDVLSLPGFVAAQRLRLADTQIGENNPHKYLALYEIETDDLKATLAELMDWFGDNMIVTDAFDLKNMGAHVFSPLAGKVLQNPGVRSRRRTA